MDTKKKTILIKTDGFSIDHFFYDSFEAAKEVMDAQYAALMPEDMSDDDKDMSYCSESGAILYRNGEDVYVWKICIIPEPDPITIEVENESEDNTVTITRLLNGQEYVIPLTGPEIEQTFRYKDLQYLKEDAQKHLQRYFDFCKDDEDWAGAFTRRFGRSLEEIQNDDAVLEALAESFSHVQDCNVAENVSWGYIVGEYFDKLMRDTKAKKDGEEKCN